MAALLKEESTITAKGQTTVPKAVRQALGVDYGGRITFLVDDQHRVYVEKAVEETNDPVVDHFLAFLARDMTKHPGKSIVALPTTLRDRIAALTENMDVDLDAEIDGAERIGLRVECIGLLVAVDPEAPGAVGARQSVAQTRGGRELILRPVALEDLPDFEQSRIRDATIGVALDGGDEPRNETRPHVGKIRCNRIGKREGRLSAAE